MARNGVAASGSPWRVDSLHVAEGEMYDVAFVADNLAGVALLLPEGSAPRSLMLGAGAAAGAASWVTVPVWFWQVGSWLRTYDSGISPTPPCGAGSIGTTSTTSPPS